MSLTKSIIFNNRVCSKKITKNNKIIKYHTQTKQRYHIHTKIKSMGENVVFDYLDLVSKMFCQESIDVHYCVQNLLIPPPEEQSRILLQFYNIETKVDMQGLDMVFVKLIMANDQETIDTLVKCLSSINHSIEIINKIILYSRNIEIMTNTILSQF